MPAEARVTKLWVQQKGLIPFLFIAFGLYFFYDGFIGYPFSDERWSAHERLKEQPGAWEAFCKEKGWATKPPEKFLGPKKYREQFIFGGITSTIGLVALVYWLRQKNTVIRSSETAVTTPAGHEVPYEAITLVDKRRWKSKGFAYITYQHKGAQSRFTLDDAKYDAKALDVILADIAERSKARIEE